MSAVLYLLQAAVAVLFVLLGIVAFAGWARHRRPEAGWLALSIGMVGIVAATGRLGTLAPAGLRTALAVIGAVALVGSGYGLLRFRGSFLRLGPAVHRAALVVLGAALLLELVALLEPGWLPRPVRVAVVAVLVLAWSLSVGDPVVRFALAARRAPAVQASRLWALALGFGGLIVIVLLAGLAPDLARAPYAALASQVVALAMVPLLYISFAPPTWLRRLWREPEEERLRAAFRDLVLFSPTRKEMARRAAEWAVRLLGGDAALIAEPDRTLLAHIGISEEDARHLLAATGSSEARIERTGGPEPRTAIIAPLELSAGRGTVIVLAGPYTPFFGADELARLTNYSLAVVAGLDRAQVTERLAALERTKSEFLNLASHELRGPVTLIRGYISMLAAGSFGELPGELRSVLPLLEAKADEMNNLIEQMIEAARLEEGRLELHPADTDLRAVAERALDMIRPLAGDSHQLVLESSEPEVRAYVDPDRIGTILSNLLSNALKYSPGGGEVRCSVSREDGRAVIAVSDHGVGIAGEDLNTLFTRFGRISNRETAHVGGTGLGLYLSRELAKLHGGDLSVTSEPGRGSTFRVELPLETAS
jgi:signal transduction histidine kinase